MSFPFALSAAPQARSRSVRPELPLRAVPFALSVEPQARSRSVRQRERFRAEPWVVVALSAMLFSASACTEKSAPVAPADSAGDRTLEKLKAEVDRANRGEAIGRGPDHAELPNEKLAGIIAGDDKPRKLALPPKNETGYLGPIAIKLAEVTAMHSVRTGRLSLTTDELFLEVKLAVQNTGAAPSSMDLAVAHVMDGAGNAHRIAQDVQRGAGTKELLHTYPPEQRGDVTLYFEIPPAVVGHGLRLVIPAGASPDARGNLELPLD